MYSFFLLPSVISPPSIFVILRCLSSVLRETRDCCAFSIISFLILLDRLYIYKKKRVQKIAGKSDAVEQRVPMAPCVWT